MIGEYLTPGDKVLDVGCGDGSALKRHPGIEGYGIDSCPHWGVPVGDARSLEFEDKSFDVVYTTRTLINLQSWEDQKKAIKECLRVSRKLVIFSEAFWEPFCRLNALRHVVGLEPLKVHDFNLYLDQSKFEAQLPNFELREFMSTYYFGSRVFREMVDVSRDYKNPVNTIFYEFQKLYPSKGVGVQMAYIVRV